MSARATAEIVADLREWIEYCREAALESSVQIGTADQVIATMTDAADRLEMYDGLANNEPAPLVLDELAPDARWGPVRVCPHGRVQSWYGTASPGERLPDIEHCDICNPASVRLDRPAQ